jgi:hypothetical protein
MSANGWAWWRAVTQAAQGSIHRRTAAQAGLSIKQESVSDITNTKKGWWSSSTGRVPAQSPKFNSQYSQNNKVGKSLIELNATSC